MIFTEDDIQRMYQAVPSSYSSNPIRSLQSYFDNYTGYTLEFEQSSSKLNEETTVHIVDVLVNKVKLATARSKFVRHAKELAAKNAIVLMQDKDKLVELLREAAR